jgi:hypothetical protein
MAKRTGHQFEYFHPYLEYCAATHAASDDIPNYFETTTASYTQVAEHVDIPTILIEANRNFVEIISYLIESLDFDLRKSLEVMNGRIDALESKYARGN